MQFMFSNYYSDHKVLSSIFYVRLISLESKCIRVYVSPDDKLLLKLKHNMCVETMVEASLFTLRTVFR